MKVRGNHVFTLAAKRKRDSQQHLHKRLLLATRCFALDESTAIKYNMRGFADHKLLTNSSRTNNIACALKQHPGAVSCPCPMNITSSDQPPHSNHLDNVNVPVELWRFKSIGVRDRLYPTADGYLGNIGILARTQMPSSRQVINIPHSVYVRSSTQNNCPVCMIAGHH